MINRVAAALALLCLAVPATAQPSEDQWARCKGSSDTDPGLTLAACTALIQAGTYSDANLSILFMNRGIASARTEQRQLALNDWVKALSLDRTNATWTSSALPARCATLCQ